MNAVSVERVEKKFGSGARAVQALRGVDLQVKPGEIYGLLGRNGAGKTTLVKVLLDIVRPTSGSSAILGTSSRSPAARRSIGYLPEDHRFPEYRTGEGALYFYGRLSGVSGGTLRSRVAELLEFVDLGKAARRKIRSYSKGMKQRLGLAQALVHDPQVLFLDEPTDGVDPVGRAVIRDMLAKLKDDGKTIFLNSHLLSEVERICDRVGILENGELVREGTIDALTRSERVVGVTTVPALGPSDIEALLQVATAVEPLRGAKATADTFEIGLAQDDDLDRVVDLLRARNLSIRWLAMKKLSLEEVFLGAVRGESETPPSNRAGSNAARARDIDPTEVPRRALEARERGEP